MALLCGTCKYPLSADHECILRGRRTFLLGALAAPLVARLPLVSAPMVHVVYISYRLTGLESGKMQWSWVY